MTKLIYFEDLYVGQRFRSEQVEVTAEAIIRFARDNDPQFFHLDDEAAKDSVFGGLVASGWQTAALAMRLLLSSADAPFAGGVVGADVHVSWKRPVRPGDRLYIESEITKRAASSSRADRGFVTFNTTTFNQAGDKVQMIDSRVVVFRDPGRCGAF